MDYFSWENIIHVAHQLIGIPVYLEPVNVLYFGTPIKTTGVICVPGIWISPNDFRNLFPSPIPTKWLSDGKVPPKEHLISQAQVFSDWHHRKAPSVATKAAGGKKGWARRDGMGVYLEKSSWTNWTSSGLSYQKNPDSWYVYKVHWIFIFGIFFNFQVRGVSFRWFFSKKQPQA